MDFLTGVLEHSLLATVFLFYMTVILMEIINFDSRISLRLRRSAHLRTLPPLCFCLSNSPCLQSLSSPIRSEQNLVCSKLSPMTLSPCNSLLCTLELYLDRTLCSFSVSQSPSDSSMWQTPTYLPTKCQVGQGRMDDSVPGSEETNESFRVKQLTSQGSGAQPRECPA